METETLSTVNAEPEQIVDVQEEPTSEPVNAGSEEVTSPPSTEKPIQTPEQNAEFAKIRRESEAKATAKARDELIAEMYGEQGIYTYEDYQKALAEQNQQMEIERLTSEGKLSKELAEELYLSRQERAERQKQAEIQEQNQKREEEYRAFLDFWKEVNGREWTEQDGIPETVLQSAEKGVSLKYAYSEHIAKQLISEKQISQKNQENQETSPGSITNGTAQADLTPQKIKDAGLSREDVLKNWNLIKFR